MNHRLKPIYQTILQAVRPAPASTRPVRQLAASAALWLILSCMPSAAWCQQESLSREERMRQLELLRMQDVQWEQSTLHQMSAAVPTEIEKMELPPLSVFLDAVVENASVKRAQVAVEQAENEYKIEKRNWLNYFRVSGAYSFGRYNIISNATDEFTPMYQTATASAQHNFNIGASVTVGIGDLVNRPRTVRSKRYTMEQLQYTREELMEERRLRILEAYNVVTEQLATIKAKAETAALYNAQMKLAENDFIQGKINFSALGVERGRRTDAVTSYESSRVALHNSILLLEMLTNVKIIKDK